MMILYILDENHKVIGIPTEDISKWVKFVDKDFETTRRVKLDFIGDKEISTIFLSVNTDIIFSETLRLFETAVFDLLNKDEYYRERCSTWDEAVDQHNRIVEKIKKEQANVKSN